MYKNLEQSGHFTHTAGVSILVLMDLCIKTVAANLTKIWNHGCFNPCFNGSMYKNSDHDQDFDIDLSVSILVLMDLCIKTRTC